jgi:hypothetical protein
MDTFCVSHQMDNHYFDFLQPNLVSAYGILLQDEATETRKFVTDRLTVIILTDQQIS